MENWKQVADSVYEVSDLGRVRNIQTGTFVQPYWQGKYLAFTIHRKRKRQVVRMQVAVLEAFVSERPKGMVAAHLDGDPSNNRLDNLIWATFSENEAHKVLHGTHSRGEKSPHSKFTNSEAELIRKAYSLGLSRIDLARLTKVNVATIDCIVSGKRYQST